MINNDDPRCYTYKKQRTAKKSNGLYIVYDLSDADLVSDLYKNYINISNKRLQEKRRTYLIAQEKVYKNNNMVFPEWAQKELEHLRTIKNNNSSRYRNNNWALTQLNNIENRNAYINIQQDMHDCIACDECGCRLQRYEEEIKLCQQLHNENQEAKKKQSRETKKIVSKEEYDNMLLNKKRKDKERYNEMAREACLPHSKLKTKKPKIKKIFRTYKINKQTPINVSNTIDLSEDKMEQNQQINK
ncbi:MAG: hypothetical protein IJT14_04155 [Rickettsiales bacterium]|nr:hypothetical protein [Rickettsiales bacterium]